MSSRVPKGVDVLCVVDNRTKVLVNCGNTTE